MARPLSVTFVQVTATWQAPQTLPCGGWLPVSPGTFWRGAGCRCSRPLPQDRGLGPSSPVVLQNPLPNSLPGGLGTQGSGLWPPS